MECGIPPYSTGFILTNRRLNHTMSDTSESYHSRHKKAADLAIKAYIQHCLTARMELAADYVTTTIMDQPMGSIFDVCVNYANQQEIDFDRPAYIPLFMLPLQSNCQAQALQKLLQANGFQAEIVPFILSARMNHDLFSVWDRITDRNASFDVLVVMKPWVIDGIMKTMFKRNEPEFIDNFREKVLVK